MTLAHLWVAATIIAITIVLYLRGAKRVNSFKLADIIAGPDSENPLDALTSMYFAIITLIFIGVGLVLVGIATQKFLAYLNTFTIF